MNIINKPGHKAWLMATAATGVVALHISGPAAAQSSIDIEFLNQTFTRLTNSTALIDNYQHDQATNVTANAQSSGGGGIDIRINLINSGGTDDSIDGSYSLNDNLIYGESYSNSATNTISASTTPAFADSSAISSNQINESDSRATASGATLFIDIYAADLGTDRVRSLTDGTAELDGNSIATVANGNTGTNTITIGDAVSVNGAGGNGTSVLAAKDLNRTVGVGQDVAVDADLAIVNAQINDGDISQSVDIVANTNASNVWIDTEAADGASISITDNTTSASARGNTMTSTLSTGGNAATIDASIALASVQANDTTIVTAQNGFTEIAIDTGTENSGATVDSSLTVTGNDVTSAAYGNNAVQTLSLNANAIVGSNDLRASIGEGAGSGDAMTATGMVTVSNLQLSSDTDVTARTQDGDIYVNIGDGSASGGEDLRNTATVSYNTFDATAVNNRATSQAVSLTGNDVGTGIAVASSQAALQGSDTTAESLRNDVWLKSNADSGSVDSTLTIDGNLDRALAIANTATTTINIVGNDVLVASDQGTAYSGGSIEFTEDRGSGGIPNYDNGYIAEVRGAYITLNDQVAAGNTNATNSGGSIQILMSGGDTTNSTLSRINNTRLAAAISNDAANTITLSMNNINVSAGSSGSGFTTVAAAMTQQTAAFNLTEAQAVADTDSSILTDNDVWGSRVANDSNTVEAMAVANRATGNILTVTANNIDTQYQGSSGGLVELDGDTYDPRASFLVQNAQQAFDATVTAYLTDDANNPTFSTEVETILGEDVGDSAISADLNVLRASSTSNSSVNALSLTAGATIATSVGAGNFQETDEGELNAVIGVEGSPAITSTAAGDATGGTSTSITDAGSQNYTNSSGGNLTVNFGQALTAVEAAYLNGLGFTGATAGGTTATWGNGDTINFSNFTGRTFYDDTGPGGVDRLTFTGFSTSSVSQRGGVFVRVNDDINDTTLSVAGNLTEGSVIGNTATNTVTVDANQILDGVNNNNAMADDDFQIVASNMAQNTQKFFDTAATSTVYGAFALDTRTDFDVSGSSLVVDGNTQLASATANIATTTLTVNATDMQGTTGLQSQQDIWTSAGNAVTATSDAWVYAPMAMTGSTLELTDNVSQAQARGNVATNTVTVSASEISGVGINNAYLEMGGDSSGGVLLQNVQEYRVSSAAASSAIDVFNEHLSDSTTEGLNASTVTLDGNMSLAEARANRATNDLSLDATNFVGATAGLSSQQDASGSFGGSIGSTATARVTFDLTESTALNSVVTDSTVTIDGNEVTALTTVNQVANTATIAATNVSGSYAESDNNASATWATFGLVNNQVAGLTATARAENVDLQVNLNALATSGDGALNSTITVDGNVTTAQVLGNRASNALNADVTNSQNASYAVSSHQENSGPLTATVLNVAGGIDARGVDTTNGSTLSVSNNSSLANAIANTANSAMVLNASNLFAAGGTATAQSPVTLEATGAVRNDQTNTGSVQALNDTVAYSVVLNASSDAMLASHVALVGNSILSQAMGNSASSSLVVTALAVDTATYGVQSYQNNTGNITAGVVDSSVVLTSTGSISASMASVSSNTLGAVATANSVINTLRR